MFKYLLLTLSVVSLFALTSCSYSIRDKNLQNLQRVQVGMTKQQVLDIMGEPLVNEVYNTENAWFYFTQVKWSDGSITHDECTPIFFKDGSVAGWGNQEYKAFRQRNW